MLRTAFALLVVAGFAESATAQRRSLPLSPGVYPGSSIGPGTQFLPAPHFVPPPTGAGARSMQPTTTRGLTTTVPRYPYSNFGFGLGYSGGYGYGGYGYGGYGYGYGGYGYGGYGSGYGGAAPVVVEFVTLGPPAPRVTLANEFPATLSLQFPAAAEVWLNGKSVKGEANEERVLTSPVLKPGEKFTFEVKARWELGGKAFESSRSVTLESGDRSRLLVVSGTEVK